MNIISLDEYRERRARSRVPRILVVDDQSTVQIILRELLVNAGYEVKLASSGEQALEYLGNEKYDLVMLDIVMPGMNGFQVLEQLRSKHSMDELPVMMATIKRDSSDIRRALSMGANDYILKPFDFKKLLERIRFHLGLEHERGRSG